MVSSERASQVECDRVHFQFICAKNAEKTRDFTRNLSDCASPDTRQNFQSQWSTRYSCPGSNAAVRVAGGRKQRGAFSTATTGAQNALCLHHFFFLQKAERAYALVLLTTSRGESGREKRFAPDQVCKSFLVESTSFKRARSIRTSEFYTLGTLAHTRSPVRFPGMLSKLEVELGIIAGLNGLNDKVLHKNLIHQLFTIYLLISKFAYAWIFFRLKFIE